MAGRERQAEVGTVAELLEEIESENLYQVLGKSVKKDCLYQLLFTIRQQRQGGFQPVHHDRIDNGFCNVHRFISDKVGR